VVDQGEFFYRKEVQWEEATQAKFLSWPRIAEIISAIGALVAKADDFSATNLEATFRAASEPLGLKFKDLVHPTRFSLTGHSSGPSLFHLMEVLGRDKCLLRLSSASVLLKAGG